MRVRPRAFISGMRIGCALLLRAAALYIATSNRDGRGIPTVDDDRILRVVPSR